MEFKQVKTNRYGSSEYRNPYQATLAAVRDWYTAGGMNKPSTTETDIEAFREAVNLGHWPLPNLEGPFSLEEVRQLTEEAFDDER